jgi:septum site-determining protein MinD
MTRVISVVSGKGGTGKTTTTVNLSTSLAQQGHEVLIIDGNLSGANVSQHFGLGFQDVSLNDVLEGEAYITQAVAKHSEGVSVLPASILDFGGNFDNLKHSIVDFLGEKDFVFIDAAAGVGDEVQAAVEASDEVLLVSEPELPSLTNCLGAKKVAEQYERDVIGLVLNSVRGESSEVSREDIKDLMETEIIGEIDDHPHVREGIALREPVASYRPESKVSKQFEKLAYRVKGEEPPQYGALLKAKIKLQDISPL